MHRGRHARTLRAEFRNGFPSKTSLTGSRSGVAHLPIRVTSIQVEWRRRRVGAISSSKDRLDVLADSAVGACSTVRAPLHIRQ